MSGVCVGDIGESETHTDREIENAMDMLTPGSGTSSSGEVTILLGAGGILRCNNETRL